MNRTHSRTLHKRRKAIQREPKTDYCPVPTENLPKPTAFAMLYKPGKKVVTGKRISYEPAIYLRFNIRKRPTEQQRALIIAEYERSQSLKKAVDRSVV